MQVIKRDKTKEVFQTDKIKKAVEKAFESCNKEPDYSVIDCIQNIYNIDSDDEVGVEEIQDNVENCLMNIDKDVAKAYIIYRYSHKVIRETNDKLFKDITKKLLANDVQNQNANLDEYSFGGRKGEVTELVLKDYALKHCMSRKTRNNHLNNEIYIHDLGSYADGEHNCLTLPIDNLLRDGTITRQVDIRPANSINTAFQLLAVYFQIQSLQQFGGVAVSHLDWTMVPYVRKSFFKHFVECYICDEAKTENIDFNTLSSEELDNYKASKKEKFKTKYNISDEDFTMGDFKIKVVKFHVDDENIKSINKDWYNKAYYETKNELSQAVEGLYHNLNSLQSRSGNQLPFSSANYGTCTLPEGQMVIEALLDGSLKGTGKNHLTPIFPCGIFQVGNGINKHPGEPNYFLFRKALKSTAKRIYPNYANLDWSGNEGYDKNDPRTYFSTMGCRTANGYDINAEEGQNPQLKDGRGNICPQTIIMPTLAMEVLEDSEVEGLRMGVILGDKEKKVDKFMRLLSRKIDQAKDSLIERFERIASQNPKSASFMWDNRTMFGYKKEEGIRSALKHGTLAVGY